MRVLLNADSLVPPLTGIGRYTRELVAGLLGHQEVESVRCFSGSRLVEAAAALRALEPARAGRGGCAAPPAATGPQPLAARGLEPVLAQPPARRQRLRGLLRSMPGAYRLRAALGARALRAAARACIGAVYHEPGFVLRDYEGPRVATVHDLSFLHHPEHHPRARARFLARELPRTLERADRLITDCEFVRAELVARFGVAPGRVHAVPLGVDPAFAPRPDAQLRAPLAALGLAPRRYVLSVATFEPRKNLERLVRAFLALPEALRRAQPLVLAGAPGWGGESLDRLLARGARDGSVRRLGWIDEQRLPLLYAGATLFAFASLYEGFGLPPLEAMASGVPVAVSDAASLPEVVGDAGLAFEPRDESAIGQALRRALEDEAWRAQAARRGLERAAGFGWGDCVERTLAVYRLAARD